MIRNRRYNIKPIYNNSDLIGYDVLDGDKVVLSHDTDYFIYMKNINFKDDGSINGRYLGEATDILIDNYARDVVYQNGKHMMCGRPVKTARMMVVKNNSKDKKIIVVIQ